MTTSGSRGRPTSGLPILVGLLSILIGVIGGFLGIIGGVLLGTGTHLIPAPDTSAISWAAVTVTGDPVLIGTAIFIAGIVLLVVAGGLWQQESWALYLTGVALLGEIVTLVVADKAVTVLLVVLVLLFIYLIAVRDSFV